MPIFKTPGARLRLHGKPRRRSWGTSTTTMEERCSSKLTKLALIVILILIVSIVIIIITVKLSKQCTLKRCNRQSRVTFICANLSNDLTAYCWPNAVITYPVTSIKESHKKRKWKFLFGRKSLRVEICVVPDLSFARRDFPLASKLSVCTLYRTCLAPFLF